MTRETMASQKSQNYAIDKLRLRKKNDYAVLIEDAVKNAVFSVSE